MQPLGAVINRHRFPNIGHGRLPGFVSSLTGPFPLQAAEEPFHWRIVSTVTYSIRDHDHTMLFQQRAK